MRDHAERRDRLRNAVLLRVADLSAEKQLGPAMILAGFDVLTAAHSDLPKDPAVLALIRDDFPDATPELAGARALLVSVFAMAMGISKSQTTKYIITAKGLPVERRAVSISVARSFNQTVILCHATRLHKR